MRINTPVTDTERTFSPTQQLIPLTNKKGIITHANDIFVDVSGFSRQELAQMGLQLGADVPFFLEANRKPWMGIVKNRCKNGDYYWVDAYVAPVFENGQISGYQSIRVEPQRKRVARATRIYKKIMTGMRASRRGTDGRERRTARQVGAAIPIPGSAEPSITCFPGSYANEYRRA